MKPSEILCFIENLIVLNEAPSCATSILKGIGAYCDELIRIGYYPETM